MWVWLFIISGAMFILGAILLIVAGAGVELSECPAIIGEFPADKPTCKPFAILVLAAGAMTVVGGIFSSWILAFRRLPS